MSQYTRRVGPDWRGPASDSSGRTGTSSPLTGGWACRGTTRGAGRDTPAAHANFSIRQQCEVRSPLDAGAAAVIVWQV